MLVRNALSITITIEYECVSARVYVHKKQKLVNFSDLADNII